MLIFCQPVSNLLNSIPQPEFGAFQVLTSKVGYPVCCKGYKPSPEESPGLLVQVWSNDGEGVFYGGSHHQQLNTIRADVGWRKVPKENLSEARAQSISFAGGGL